MPFQPLAILAVLLLGAAFPGPARGEDDHGYARLARSLPKARLQDQVDSAFLRFLDSLRRLDSLRGTTPGTDRSASSLAKRWAADAARETHEETRLWYSLGMERVRGKSGGSPTLSQFRLGTGQDLEVYWPDGVAGTPPSRAPRVELALREPTGPGAAVRYRPLGSWELRKDSLSFFWRRRMDKPGIYRVTLLSETFFQQAYAQVTDLEVLIKEDGDRFLVWGASPGNRLKPPYRLRAEGPGGWALDMSTDGRGLALLEVPKDPDFRKSVRVVLEKGGHAALAGGSNREPDRKQPVLWLFTDRPRYRPGDRVHIRGVVKTRVGDHDLEDGWTGPMRLSFTDARDAQAHARTVAVDAWGNFGDSLDLAADVALGDWHIAAGRPDTGGSHRGQTYGAAVFQVEEYRKPDFRLEAESRWIDSVGKYSLRIAARYPDGTPTGGIPVEIKWFAGDPRREQDPFFGEIQAYPTEERHTPRDVVLRLDTLRLDAQGRAELQLVPPAIAGSGWVVEMTGRDRAGRAVREAIPIRKAADDRGLRIETSRTWYASGSPARFRIIARDSDGRPGQGKVWLKFMLGGKPHSDTVLDLDAAGKAFLVRYPVEIGQWSILADLDPERPEAAVDEVIFQVTRPWIDHRTLENSVPDQLIRIDPIPVQNGPGDSARFLLQGDWGAAPILVTLEGPSLGAWAVLPPGDGSRLSASLPLARNASGRVRIRAGFLGYKGWESESAWLDLADSAHTLYATLDAASTWKPGERFQGSLRVTDARGRPARVRFSLGVTDEAVHQGIEPQHSATVLVPARQINRVHGNLGATVEDHLRYAAGVLRIPGPRAFNRGTYDRKWDAFDSAFYQVYLKRWKQRRAQESRILFGRDIPYFTWLDHGVFARAMSMGEGGRRGPQEIRPMRTDFRDLAWWSPMIATDSSGRAQVEFPWPEDIALWRLSARGAGPGAALLDFRDTLATRLDLSVRLVAPRAFTVGDSALVTALVSNGTGKTLPAVITFATGDSAVALPAGPGRKVLELPPGATPVRFPVRLRKAGRAEFQVALRAGEYGDGETRTFPVIETGTREVLFRSGPATRRGDPRSDSAPPSGKPFRFAQDAGYRSGSAEVEVELYSIPALALVGPVENLLAYPYGCVEQTLNRFVPMLQAVSVLRKLGIRREDLERRMQGIADSGLSRLEGLQLPEGGWGWWTEKRFDPYLTALVAEGLHRTSRADLPPEFRRRSERLRDRGLEGLRKGAIADSLDPAVAAVVARALSTAFPVEVWKRHFDRTWSARSSLSLGTMAQAMTLARQAGDTGREREALAFLKENFHIPETGGKAGRWTITDSVVRDLAEVLIALTDAGREPETAARIAAWLHGIRRGEGWGSTLATARVLEALSRVAEGGQGPADGRVHLEVNGRRLRSEAVTPGLGGTAYLEWTLSGPALDSALRRGDNALEVIHEGNGRIHYAVRLFRHVAAPARPAAAAKGGTLAVTRVYRRVWYAPGPRGTLVRKTAPAGAHAFRIGDEVEVRLQVESRHGGGYLLLEDPVPGGMEYLPPGQEELGRYGYSLGYRGDHLEARDDRVALFATWIAPGRTEFAYSLRASSRGRFLARPARAEHMYQPEIRAESKPATLSILP